MKNRFQYVLSLSILAIFFIGFFVHSLWVEEIIYNNLKNQALKDNLTIGETVLGMFDKSGVSTENRTAFVQMVQETCDVMKMPNKGFICMMDSTGVLLAAPGLKSGKKIRISKASFHSKEKDKKYSFVDFFLIDPFIGYYEYEEIGYSNVVVAMKHRYSGYKLMVHQDANMIKEQAREKSITILLVGLSFATLISIFAYFIINRQVKRYQFRIEVQNEQLAVINNEIKDNNKALEIQNFKLKELADEKDALLGIMAHDLKNPIGGIKSVINLVNSAGSLNTEQIEYFSLLESQVKSAQIIIADVLEMNTLECNKKAIQKDQVDLVKLLQKKLNVFGPLAGKKNIGIVGDYGVSELWIEIGISELNRIVDNLLSNSIKYSPFGKKIILRLSREKECVVLEFIDEGKGIQEKEMNKLFKKFSKLSARPTNDEESSGLGLYIVKLLTAKIGAEINVVSTYGKGSVFSLVLPLNPK